MRERRWNSTALAGRFLVLAQAAFGRVSEAREKGTGELHCPALTISDFLFSVSSETHKLEKTREATVLRSLSKTQDGWRNGQHSRFTIARLLD